jgi:hypothetical protein
MVAAIDTQHLPTAITLWIACRRASRHAASLTNSCDDREGRRSYGTATNKRAAGRLKDLADLDALRAPDKQE